ncbi:MAG: MBL fold metallo-hydrolase [Pseudomonadota bacterium]
MEIEIAGGAPPVLRITADNPSPMTAEGTNSFLVGREALALIDPGPEDAAHLAAMKDAAGGRPVFGVFVTHSHLDHSAGAQAAAEALGAPILAFGDHHAGRRAVMRRLAEAEGAAAGLGGGEGADLSFAPDRRLADDEIAAPPNGEPWRLRALHTPGHTANHLSFALEAADGEAYALFCGDHVMAWSTSIVSPPDGDMGAYMASLARLAARDDPLFLPAHGATIAEPQARLAELIAHRKGREAAALAALESGAKTPAELARAIYRALDPRLLPLAERNMLAHLIDLWERGRAAPEGGRVGAAARFALTSAREPGSDSRSE